MHALACPSLKFRSIFNMLKFEHGGVDCNNFYGGITVDENEVFNTLSYIYTQAESGAGEETEVVGPYLDDWTVKQYSFRCSGNEYTIRRRCLAFEWGDFWEELVFIVEAFSLFPKDSGGWEVASAIRIYPGDKIEPEYSPLFQMNGNFTDNVFTGVWDKIKNPEEESSPDRIDAKLLMMLKLSL